MAQLVPVGNTEVAYDSLHPVFDQGLAVEYHFEQRQDFVLKVYSATDNAASASPTRASATLAPDDNAQRPRPVGRPLNGSQPPNNDGNDDTITTVYLDESGGGDGIEDVEELPAMSVVPDSEAKPARFITHKPALVSANNGIFETSTLKSNEKPRMDSGSSLRSNASNRSFEAPRSVEEPAARVVADKVSEVIGELSFQLGRVMCSERHRREFEFTNGRGKVTVAAVGCGYGRRDSFDVTFSARNLAVGGCFNSPNAYLIVNRYVGDSTLSRRVVETEPVRSEDPNWIPIRGLNLGDLAGPKLQDKVVCLEVMNRGACSRKVVGSSDVSVLDLMMAEETHRPLMLYKRSDVSIGPVGEIYCTDYTWHSGMNFEDFLAEGYRIRLILAVDFTESNGDPSSETSHHYTDSNIPNPYVFTFLCITEVLRSYTDTDGGFEAFGFSAVHNKKAMKMFPLGLRGEVFGDVKDIISSYKNALSVVKLGSKAKLAPVVKHAAQQAKDEGMPNKLLYVLAILCDGDVDDVDETIEELVNADEAPLFILLFGIGERGEEKSFSPLLQVPLTSIKNPKKVIRRKLVHYCPMHTLHHESKAAVTKDSLGDLPLMVEDWAWWRGIKPSVNKVVPRLQVTSQGAPFIRRYRGDVFT
jgi:hypothetical protein